MIMEQFCYRSPLLFFLMSFSQFFEISTLLFNVVPVKSKLEILQNFVAFFSEYMNFIEEFVSLSPLFSIRIYLGLYVFVFDQILTKFGKILRIALGRKNVGFLFFSKLETRTLHLFYSRIYSSPLTYAIIVFPKIIAQLEIAQVGVCFMC